MKAKWAVRTSAVAILFGLVVALPRMQRHFFDSPLAFDTVEDAAATIRTAGLHVTADNPAGKLQYGFLVSREPMQWLDATKMRRHTYNQPEWTGKAWLTRSWKTLGGTDHIPEGAGVRFWGEIIAFGDPDFLEEMEQAMKKGERA